jgi:hypothetical protein
LATGVYYGKSEDENEIGPFLRACSPFLREFKLLDTRKILELACGHGGHAARVLKKYPV